MQVQIISEMRVHEKGIVPIYADEENEHFVNARELHAFLDVGRDFSSWIKDRIAKYGFVEDEDYVCLTNLSSKEGRGGQNAEVFPRFGENSRNAEVFAKTGENPQGGRPKTEYILTLDTAKEIAMVENNERGREVRRYFIEVEKRVRRMLSSPRLLEEMKAELKDAIKEELRNELSLPIRENVISEFPQPIRVIGDLVVRLYKGIPVVSSFDLALTFNRKHFRIVCDIRNTYCGDTLYEHEELFHRCDIVPVDGRREEHFFITVNGLDLLFRRWGGWGPAWKRRELLENFKRAEKDHLGLSDD